MNSLFTDLCSDAGVPLPSLQPETTAGIATLLEGRGHAGNPTDASGQLTRPSFQQILALFEADPAVDLIAIGLTQLASGERSRQTAQHITQAYASAFVPYVAVWASATTMDGIPTVDNAGVKQVQAAGIPVFDRPAKAAQALGMVRRYRVRRDMVRSELGSDAHHDLKQAVTFDPTDHLSALDLLAGAGIPVARTEAADTVERALDIAQSIGFPIVLKIDAPGLLHKTEVGGVRLHVQDPAALALAYRELWEATAGVGPDRRVLVQEEVSGGAEFLLGGLMDPIFGPVVTLGSGGIWVELADDVTSRVAPVHEATAPSMLDDLKSRRILAGVRGASPRDVESLVDAVVRFSALFAGLQGVVEEMECNPLLVLPQGQGVRAVDALVVAAADGDPSRSAEEE
jgi:acetate---CoA ligase (ADP-forming)